MRETEFIALVERLEVYEREHPAAYRIRVALLAALGYLILFGVLGITLLFIAALIYGRRFNVLIASLLVTLLILSGLIIKSLWVKFEEPEGQELKYDDAPRLFDLLRDVRKATDGPRLHNVLLTSDCNAMIVQQPRLGIFGSTNYMLLGLPLLRALSTEDIRAVVAHEFGHLSGKHGWFSGWIYRVRQTWIQFMENMHEHRNDFPMFGKFFNWYAPYFEAYSHVLARAHEYEADQCAVTVSGKENVARAFVKLRLKRIFLSEEFWPEIYRRVETQPEPPGRSFSELMQSLNDPLPPEKTKLWFADTLKVRHRYDDTHPALADRLAAMGYPDVRKGADLESFLVADERQRADQFLLAHLKADYIEQLNNSWKEDVSENWRERHKFVGTAQQELAAFVEKAKTAELTVEERWQRAELMINKEGVVAAKPLLHEVLALMPDHCAANFNLGDALLSQGDEAGIKYLETAMEKDVHSIPTGCGMIAEFLTAHERRAEADKYRDCAGNYYDEAKLAQHERTNISKKDRLEPHRLSSEALNDLREQLANYPLLSSAYLVRKVCAHFPDDPCYVLGVYSKRRFGLQLDSRDAKLVSELAGYVNFPGYTYIIPLEKSYKPLRKIFKRMDGAEIYRAS